MIPTMGKVYPQLPITTTATTSSSSSGGGEERYTIWTKSLICHGNGCTVFDSRGRVAYRVDNYGVKKSRQVYLMDLHGNVLFSLLKPHNYKLMFYFGTSASTVGCWNGYKGTPNDNNTINNYKEMPWFQVRKNSKRSASSSCQVILGSDLEAKEIGYKIIDKGITGKKKAAATAAGAGFDVTDRHGNLVAQVKHKESTCGGGGGGGVLLGDDVLSLVVQPQQDHSLVMALVIVYGLITNIIM